MSLKSNNKGQKHKINMYLIPVFFTGILSLFISNQLLSIGNTLAKNDRWISSKTKMAKHVSLSQTYMHSRQALAKGRLNLSAWNGYQELIFKEALDVKRVEFDYYLGLESYLIFIFNKTDSGFDGIRISNNSDMENILFSADVKGRFVNKRKIEDWKTNKKDWHHAKVEFEDDSVFLYVDGHLKVRYSIELRPDSFIGFRSGQNKVFVDNVRIEQKGGGLVFTEDFKNRKNKIFIFFVVFVSLLFVFVLLLIYLKKKGVFLAELQFTLFALQFVLAVVVVLFAVFDYNFSQIRYPSRASLDDEENFFVDNEEQVRIKEIMSKYDYPVGNDEYRVMFIGSSQTWGEGARVEDDLFSEVVERKLNDYQKKYKFECINAGIRGTNSKMLYGLYEKELIKLKPKVLFVNLSNNDSPSLPEQFQDYLEKFISINNSRGIKTIFIYEANSPEHRDELFLISVMRDIVSKNDMKGIDMNLYLKNHNDDGLLWWDNVHMTSFGQELMGEKIFSEVTKKGTATFY